MRLRRRDCVVTVGWTFGDGTHWEYTAPHTLGQQVPMRRAPYRVRFPGCRVQAPVPVKGRR